MPDRSYTLEVDVVLRVLPTQSEAVGNAISHTVEYRADNLPADQLTARIDAVLSEAIEHMVHQSWVLNPTGD